MQKIGDILENGNIELVERMRKWKPPEKQVKNCPYCGSIMEAVKDEYKAWYGTNKFEVRYGYNYVCPNRCAERRKLRVDYAERYRNAKNKWNNAGLSRECIGWNLSKMTCENIDFLREYAETFTKFSKALILKGYQGTGKSLSSECIVKSILKKGLTARITNMTEINIEMNSALRKDEYQKYLDRITGYDLLVIDDFLREPYATEKSFENVFQLFNTLTKKKKAYIISVNPENLAIMTEKPQLSAVLDRFKDTKNVKVLDFVGESFRK